jgi:hypothetical protein
MDQNAQQQGSAGLGPSMAKEVQSVRLHGMQSSAYIHTCETLTLRNWRVRSPSSADHCNVAVMGRKSNGAAGLVSQLGPSLTIHG